MSVRKKVFITGITGLLGTNLANLLLEKNFEVIGIARNPKKYYGNRGAHLTIVRGNLFDDYSELLKDVYAVVHIAADTSQNGLDYDNYRRVNVDATQHLYELADRNNVEHFIFISTANTSGFGNREKPGDESTPMKKPFSQSYYAKSKKEAEQYLLKQKSAMSLQILCPTFMIGAYDSKPSSGRIILMALGKKVLFYPPGGKCFVSVSDVAKAVVQSFTCGKTHEKYLICSENLSYRDFFKKVTQINNQKTLMIKIPKFLLLFVGFIGDILRRFRIKTEISSTNMQSLCIGNYYSNAKSKTELQVHYENIDRAIEKAVAYFKKDYPKVKHD